MSGEHHEDEPDQSASYEVGYGKPPKAPRFKKGHSGNPGGKSKRSRSGDYFDQVMERKHTINQNGRRRVVTSEEALIEKLWLDAINGDATARRLVLKEREERKAKGTQSGWTIIHARPVLEEEPPLPIREAIDQLTGALEMLGSSAPQELRDALDKFVSYYRAYYRGWSPRPLN